MTPLYARNLFGLLKLLGYPQQTIAKALGASSPSVSQWARGHRPIPARYHQKFFKLLINTIAQHDQTHHQQIRLYLCAWGEEMHVQLGICSAYIQTCVESLQNPIYKTDPLTLAPEERARLRETARVLMLHLDYLDRVATRTPYESPHLDGLDDPFELLQRLCIEFDLLPTKKAWDAVFKALSRGRKEGAKT
jgi:predicted transcriptional regulator